MLPAFSNNDYVMTSYPGVLKKDDVVVIKLDDNFSIIKRVDTVFKNEFKVTSDNKSYASKFCNKKYKYDDVVGKVIFKLPFIKSWIN
tara:strand:- start:577 stop:837 length:261 start_codon:yes stop_codon:yes gene_type:complete